MPVDAARLTHLLGGSILGGRSVEAIPVPGIEDVALHVRCSPEEVLPAWAAGHGVVDESGRWPVVAGSWDGELDGEVFDRFPFEPVAGDDVSLAAIVARAMGLDAAEVIARLTEDHAGDGYENLAAVELPHTERRVGRAPTELEVRGALGPTATRAEIDRHLLAWEERIGGPLEAPAGHLEWFEPTDMDVGVLFLPTPNCWETPAYISFFGAECPGGAEDLIVVLRSWHDRFGAELVAHYGTMLEFVVRRPPSTLEEAWPVAHEQELVAPCTTMLSGVVLRDHARCLVGRDTWFLHERP